jgi:hypothetical protein
VANSSELPAGGTSSYASGTSTTNASGLQGVVILEQV